MFGLCKSNAELKELGRLMFFAGLLAFLLSRDALLKVIGG
jgi:hypothetical protein